MRNHWQSYEIYRVRSLRADDGTTVAGVFPSLRPIVGASCSAAKLLPTEYQSYQESKPSES